MSLSWFLEDILTSLVFSGWMPAFIKMSVISAISSFVMDPGIL